MTAMEPTVTRIPTPPDFPIEWEQPGDEYRLWENDRMHFPGVITPLDDDMAHMLYSVGLAAAGEALELPVRGRAARFNGYHYLSIAPLPLPHEELDAMGERSAAKLQAAVGSLRHDWEEAFLPEVKRLISETEHVDFRSRSLAELARDLDDMLARVEREWQIHFIVAMPMLLAPSLFEEFYREVFQEDDHLAPFRLLQGLDSLTVQMGIDLFELSRQARQSPEVIPVIQEKQPETVVGALRQSEAGRRFLAQLQGWLEIYGHRGNALGISDHAWIDDPTPVIRMLKEYATRTDYDPKAEQAQLAAAREAAIAEARARLAGYPEAVVGQFEGLLAAAQYASLLSENHDYWIDFRGTNELRRVIRAVGGKLADGGVLEQEGDIGYLHLTEIGDAARDPKTRDLKALVAERKAEMARFATLTPPPAAGSIPPGPPPDNPLFRGLGKFFGWHQIENDESGVLKGVGGSKGTATGTVRVLHSLEDASKLKQGDILVVETTTPPWTPLFNTAAAVVTDTGGVLCHCAVVAREYGIPAVVGTKIATVALKDGQQVEVDGSAGTVRIVGAQP